MAIAKLFPNGGSQAVRLPKAFSFEGVSEVYIHKCGNKLILEPAITSWDPLLKSIANLPDDLDFTREPPDLSNKEDLF